MGDNHTPINSWSELQQRKEVTTEQVVDLYDAWAPTYDETVSKSQSAALALSAVLSVVDSDTNKKELNILDIAAGTGRVGQELFENGFRKIDALEPSSEMLNILKKRNVYQNVYQTFLGGGHKATMIPDDKYDMIIISGGFAKSHLPVDSLQEVIRMGKKGSIFINRMTAKNIEVDEELIHLEPFMKKLEEERRWVQISRTLDPNVTFSAGPSLTHVYRIT